jgi:pyruvate dehydrogenase phosphatase
MSLLSGQSVSVEQIRSELARVSVATVISGAHTVAFQPSRRPEDRIEDRHLIEDWELTNGTWKFVGVFDGATVARVVCNWHEADSDSELGHGAGHEAVDFVVETLPGMIKASLESAFSTEAVINSIIEEILVQCISGIDDRIKADFVNFFPGGPRQISKLTDDEIKSTIADPETGKSYVQIMRARTGTTALVALIDPLKCLHVASLGDCEASKHVEYTNRHV